MTPTRFEARRPPTGRAALLFCFTLFSTILSWAGGLPVLLTCGEDPTVSETGMNLISLNDVTQGSLLVKTGEAGTLAGDTDVKPLVRERTVVDQRTASIPIGQGEPLLALVTCYPFDTPIPGGPLRLVITAEADGF